MAELPQSWQLAAENQMDELPDIGNLALPAPLRAYQWKGIRFLMNNESALLADEMGLGKTVQAAVALRLALRHPSRNRAIVVAPASLKSNWLRELDNWAPELAVRAIDGPAADRLATYLLPIPVVIASYEQLREDVLSLQQRIKFDVAIIDEAQRIKNPDSDAALACRILPRDVSWALTGTPIENDVRDLVSVYRFVKPGLIQAGMSRPEMHARIREHFLRRRKKEVLSELPPIIVQDVPVELCGAQRASYDDLWDSRKTLARGAGVPVPTVSMLALITQLKQLCNFEPFSNESAKFDLLRCIVDGLVTSTDKLIIFSQYVETLIWLDQRLGEIPRVIFHGSMSASEKDKTIQDFEEKSGPRILLISLKAGGVGLNLPSASAVVLFDRWWNPAVENQAMQRAHRFGRDRPLLVYRFLVANSIEERIDQVLQQKADLFERYINEAEGAPTRLFDRQELRRLLGLTDVDINFPG